MTEVALYTSKKGKVSLEVSLVDETVWLSMTQLKLLFNRDKSTISKHLSNIFKSKELNKNSVVAKFATTAEDKKTYQVEYYNLDVIISLGYRINSAEGIKFRKWATQVLKDHLIQGYTTYNKRLSEIGVHELQQAVNLLQKTLIHHNLVNDLGQEALQLISNYTKTWNLLLAYDEGNLQIPSKEQKTKQLLTYAIAKRAIEYFKADLTSRNESSNLFGQEYNKGLESILHGIEQTFQQSALYKTAEEKAAHLLYFIIKDHPFTDGNKRIGSLIFLLYLKSQNIPIQLNENGLVALALLVAESAPNQKTTIIHLIINFLMT